jgi:glycerol kinase
MEKDSGHALKELAVDGGMSNSDLCMQVRQSIQSYLLYLSCGPHNASQLGKTVLTVL